MSSTFAIFLDVLVVGLMVATIAYAISLNRSIAKLRDGKEELATLLLNLSEAVAHADIAVKGLKASTAEYDASLGRQISAARALVDELRVMNETGNNVATRIERAVSAGRQVAQAAPRNADPLAPLLSAMDLDRPAETKPRKAAGGRGGAERELIEAIELLRRA